MISKCKTLILVLAVACFCQPAVALEQHDVVLYDFEKDFDVSKVEAEYAAAKVVSSDGGKALGIELFSSKELARVTFNLLEKYRDLSSKRYVEMDIKNLADKKAVLTFWALSGAGWGGISSAATTKLGREKLEPNSTTTLKIDLYGRYPGPDAIATAIDPAKVKQLRIVFHLYQAGFKFEVDNIRVTGSQPKDNLGTSARFLVPEVTGGIRL